MCSVDEQLVRMLASRNGCWLVIAFVTHGNVIKNLKSFNAAKMGKASFIENPKTAEVANLIY